MAYYIPVRLLYHWVLVHALPVFICVLGPAWRVIGHLHVRQTEGGEERVGHLVKILDLFPNEVLVHLIKYGGLFRKWGDLGQDEECMA